jgi:MoxR-like ATPase
MSPSSIPDETPAVSNEIRESITPDDIRFAIQELQAGVPSPYGPSTKYDLLYEGRRYPPKAVIGLAAGRSLGRPLRPDEFSGGESSWSFRRLKQLGFEIVPKEDSVQSLLPDIDDSHAVWVEDTKSSHLHGGKGWEFGKCLWSPSASKNGGDTYSLMREVRPGDVVIHLNDSEFVGWSTAKTQVQELKNPPPNPGQWANRPGYYRIDLDSFHPFPNTLRLTDFVQKHHERLRAEIERDSPKKYLFILYRPTEVRHGQGGYLTRCTRNLYALLQASFPRENQISSPTLDSDPQYWALACGEGGRLWNRFQEEGIVAIGWDHVGDLRKYSTHEEIHNKISETLNITDPQPKNDSLCLYQFANEMRLNDFVVAKSGRSKLLGIGRITGEYEFVESRSEFKHVRKIEWIKVDPCHLPDNTRLPLKTLTNVSEYGELIAFIQEQYLADSTSHTEHQWPPYTIDQALLELFIDRAQLERMLLGLRRKKNIILQGPPGVGKTFAARIIANTYLKYVDPERVETVQFHQSYSYEDFVQGYRPSESGGFLLRNGVFYDFCGRARINPSQDYIFIIDELNRGNLSRIFGELLMLIEPDKRGAANAIPLTYSNFSGERFSIPDNVHVIGLMNTADRSLALVDYALRRRFVFFHLEPRLGSPGFRQLLERCGGQPALITAITQKISTLNERIRTDPELGVGFEIGHSYFCPNSSQRIDEGWYTEIIETEIAPLLREYWFDKPTQRLDSIIQELLDL